ncbi:ABC transporter substrate-binding protein [Pseudomonas sp. ML96]|uniref:substrate-binding periplasmic protein n=1 Tax=Pseudomonas sp. ML96 TaxID=1523503 RepID=UPI0005B843AE|nr:transporter substrate-binding domain-containing protein [Pseudomonas sp. ML96]
MTSRVLRRYLITLLVLLLVPVARADEVFRIGAEDDWYPFTALRDGEMRGMSVDLVRAAFAASDTRIELVPYPYSRCMELTRTGQLAACFNTSPDASIATEYRLPEEPLFSDDILLWARTADARPLADLQQLVGRRVAVTIGYEYGTAFDSLAGVERVPVRRDLNGFRMLAHGRVEYTAAYRGIANALFVEHPELAGAFAPVATLHQPQLFISFSRYHPQALQLMQRYDSGMRSLHRDGGYEQIIQRWNGLLH